MFILYMVEIFVYGSLLEKSIQNTVLGREVPQKEDTLHDFIKTDHSVFLIYPTIKEHVGGSVVGRVLEVGDYDVNTLDRYESNLYKKIKVTLASGTEALTYIENKD
jgi:gamma-glutamylcyclotransferase (GGCT)/AIG2-like uncharacterized protein YtfP